MFPFIKNFSESVSISPFGFSRLNSSCLLLNLVALRADILKGFLFLSIPINKGLDKTWLAEENVSLSKLITFSFFFFVGKVLIVKIERIKSEIKRKVYLTDLIIKEYFIGLQYIV